MRLIEQARKLHESIMVNNRPFVPSQAVQQPKIAKRLEELAGLSHSIG
jgi:hypothetical protein